MAKIIPDIDFPNWGSGEHLISNIASKLGRAKILIDRNFRMFEKDDVNGPMGSYEYEPSFRAYPGPKAHRYPITGGDIERTSGIMVTEDTGGNFRQPTNDFYQREGVVKDYIAIIDIDYKPSSQTTGTQAPNDSKPKLSNRRYKELRIPFVPRELQVNPESNFVGISSFGRNNPFYQFTGAEDTLTFEIDWLATENSREDVITHCRWIEALTKGDGYNDVPHRVILMWGADNKLFREHKWLITSAPYKLINFNRGYMENNQFVNTSLLPSRAVQNITLKRITSDNISSADIIGNLNNG